MKFKFLITVYFLIVSIDINSIPINAYEVSANEFSQNQLCIDFYNRILISTNIKKFTNLAIDAKAKERIEVPASVWVNVKENINYSSFDNEVINIICVNYTEEYMTAAIAENANRTYIKIASWKVKKEMSEAANTFKPILEQQINQILSDNGY